MGNLHKIIIGGEAEIPSWKSINIGSLLNTDHLIDLKELEEISDNSVSAFYLSHVLERIPLRKVLVTLEKLFCKIIPGGTVYITVPDICALSTLLLNNELDVNDKIYIIRIIYGEQTNDFNFHYSGFSYEVLEHFLDTIGFTGIRRVKNFNLFKDKSIFAPYLQIPLSINVICHKK
jgi:predicted SAM-dependent methyltransferase